MAQAEPAVQSRVIVGCRVGDIATTVQAREYMRIATSVTLLDISMGRAGGCRREHRVIQFSIVAR